MVAVVMRCFPSLPYDRVLDMDHDELFEWYEKAIELHSKEAQALSTLIHEGEYKSPYLYEE